MLQLQLETIAACNARCVFCTYPSMRRPKGRMEDAVFEKIVNDAAEMSMFIDRIFLQGLGEPLMDKAIVERVHYVRGKFPNAEISIFTNGTLLTPTMSARLKGAGLSQLVVSLTGTNAEERKGAMGLDDYNTVAMQIDVARKILPTKVKLIASRDLIADMNTTAAAFVERWGQDAMVTWEGNWAGESSKFRGAPHVKACHRALEQLMFLWDGTMALCCFDGEGHMTFGNVKDKTVLELWEGPERTRVREQHLSGKRAEIDLCQNCTGI